MEWMMADKENKSGNASCKDIGSFLVLLAEMEDGKENIRTLSGTIEGPFSTRAVFSCIVRMGLE
jgi:hypothetical protein